MKQSRSEFAKRKKLWPTPNLVLVVIDASQPSTEDDTELLREAQSRPTIVVENKSDLVSAPEGQPKIAPALQRWV